MTGAAEGASGVLQGMTGFGRASGEAEWGGWSVEAKSVNGRGLDVRVNSPPGFDALDGVARAEAKSRFQRGNLQVGIRIEMAETGEALEVDPAALAALVQACEAAGGVVDAGAMATLMTVRGVVRTASGPGLRELSGNPAVTGVLASGITAAMGGLMEERCAEGRMLAGVLGGLLDAMEAARVRAEAMAARAPGELRDKLNARLADLGGADGLDAGRLEAEVALLASKADVREEIDRLRAHVASGRALLAEGGPVGRKIDFLAQELMREANTLCSKSTSLPLTEAGLELKVLIDQFKEQAANVE